jgi:hypothetical protein
MSNVSNKISNIETSVKNAVSNFSVSIVMFILSVILLAVIIYIFIEYIHFNKKLNFLAPVIDTEYSLITDEKNLRNLLTNAQNTTDYQIDTISNDTKYKLTLLIKGALLALKNNANKFSQLTFYTQPIEQLIIKDAWYIPVLQFAKFSVMVPTITNEVIDSIIEELFGSIKSRELFITVNGVEYYLPLEFDHAIEVYIKNKKFLDKVVFV